MKTRTARGEVISVRNELPDKVQTDVDTTPSTRHSTTCIAMFQWVNVKGWVAIIGTVTAYAAIARFPLNIVIQVLTFLAMGTASITTWTLFGSALRPVLTSARAVRLFNVAMAILLLASLIPVFMDA